MYQAQGHEPQREFPGTPPGDGQDAHSENGGPSACRGQDARSRRRSFRTAERDGSAALHAFVRGTRAAAGIELAIGAVVMLSVAAACFDLYSRVEADTTSARIAATMADYVSRGPAEGELALDGGKMKELGEFLLEHELGGDADLVFVITALRQPRGNPAPAVKVLWSDDTLRFGDDTVTTDLADTCPQYVEENNGRNTAKNLPDDFDMTADEVLIIVEVCARLTGMGATSSTVVGDIYRLHVLPLRTPEKDNNLRAPEYAHLDADVPPTARTQA